MNTNKFIKILAYLNLNFFLMILNIQGQGVKCANSVAEYQERIRLQRQEVQNQIQAYKKAEVAAAQSYDLDAKTIRALIESELTTKILRQELEMPIEVSVFSKNPDYIDIKIDARKIPIYIPDGQADVGVGFYDDKGLVTKKNFVIPICSGKINRGFKLKPQKAIKVNISSFQAVSLTYIVPNISVLMSIGGDDDCKSNDIIAEAACQEGKRREEEDSIKRQAQSLANPNGLEPGCQIDKILTTRELIESSDAIVLAKLENKDIGKTVSGNEELIPFRVKKILKGNLIPPDLKIAGVLTKTDNYYRGESDCVANTYKKGETYLFFLRKIENDFILFWYPKASVNKRISGENDNWVTEVKNELDLINSMRTRP